MKLVGITRIVSKKSGAAYMRLALLDESKSENRVGADVATEIVNFDESLVSLVGSNINIIYRKGYDGRAIVDRVEKG